MVLNFFKDRDVVHVGSDNIKHIEKECAAHDGQGYEEVAPKATAHLPRVNGGDDEADGGCRQHYAGAVAQDDIVPFVGQLLDEKAQDAANDCGAAQASGANPYFCHILYIR